MSKESWDRFTSQLFAAGVAFAEFQADALRSRGTVAADTTPTQVRAADLTAENIRLAQALAAAHGEIDNQSKIREDLDKRWYDKFEQMRASRDTESENLRRAKDFADTEVRKNGEMMKVNSHLRREIAKLERSVDGIDDDMLAFKLAATRMGDLALIRSGNRWTLYNGCDLAAAHFARGTSIRELVQSFVDLGAATNGGDSPAPWQPEPASPRRGGMVGPFYPNRPATWTAYCRGCGREFSEANGQRLFAATKTQCPAERDNVGHNVPTASDPNGREARPVRFENGIDEPWFEFAVATERAR